MSISAFPKEDTPDHNYLKKLSNDVTIATHHYNNIHLTTRTYNFNRFYEFIFHILKLKVFITRELLMYYVTKITYVFAISPMW